MGLFASVPAPANIFLSADDVLGSKEEISTWQDKACSQEPEILATALPALSSGLSKQYAIQRRLFVHPSQSQAEYVHLTFQPLTPIFPNILLY